MESQVSIVASRTLSLALAEVRRYPIWYPETRDGPFYRPVYVVSH